MRLLLAATILAIASPALADFDSLRAKIEHTHDLAERAKAAAHAALADKYRAEQAANDASDARMGGASIGLNAEGVRKSCWGKPLHVNTTMTASHTHEQWVYGGGYLYLTDGVVTSIQTSR